jgi:hypothetical protein
MISRTLSMLAHGDISPGGVLVLVALALAVVCWFAYLLGC